MLFEVVPVSCCAMRYHNTMPVPDNLSQCQLDARQNVVNSVFLNTQVHLLTMLASRFSFPPSERNETGRYTVLPAFPSVRLCALIFRCKYLENGLR